VAFALRNKRQNVVALAKLPNLGGLRAGSNEPSILFFDLRRTDHPIKRLPINSQDQGAGVPCWGLQATRAHPYDAPLVFPRHTGTLPRLDTGKILAERIFEAAE
jgi:hypothetical protein